MEVKVNLENLTDEERTQLMQLVEKGNEKKAWKPIEHERYWYILNGGECEFIFWHGAAWDENRYATGNCFKTQEEAEFQLERLKVIAELKRFAEENNDPIDWKDLKRFKHFLFYDGFAKRVNINQGRIHRINTIYFSSEEIARQAIDKIGEERIKKYYFGVEDDE